MTRRNDDAPDSRYGRFSADGTEYVVTDFRTPRPWINVVANERVGLTVSQTGSGFSWVDNSQLAVTVRWQQEFASDRSGRFLFLRDRDLGALWSLAPSPCWPAYESFAGTVWGIRPSRLSIRASRRAGRSSSIRSPPSSCGPWC